MSKSILTLVAFVALTAIFVIPSAYTPASTQVAKASTCSSAIGGSPSSSTSFGSCSTASVANAIGGGAGSGPGGTKSSCSSGSISLSGGTIESTFGNGAVSCSSQVP